MTENADNQTFARINRQTFCTYLLTIRRTKFDLSEAQNFKQYFGLLAQAGCEVLVVDGSPQEIYQANENVWCESCRHVPVDSQYKYLNGKVNGIHTGVALAAHNSIILADDDIRYTAENIGRMRNLLENHEIDSPR